MARPKRARKRRPQVDKEQEKGLSAGENTEASKFQSGRKRKLPSPIPEIDCPASKKRRINSPVPDDCQARKRRRISSPAPDDCQKQAVTETVSMARPKRARKRRPQVDKEQEKGLSAGENTEASKFQSGRKRKLPSPIPEIDCPASKKRRINSPVPDDCQTRKTRKRRRISYPVPAQDSTNKSISILKKTLQNKMEQDRKTLVRKTSQNQSTVVSSRPLKLYNLPESKAQAKKKLTQKSAVRDSSPVHVPTSAVGSDEAVKKENCALNGPKEAKKLVGAHCYFTGGLYKAVEKAVAMGGRAFGLYLRPQQSFARFTPLRPDVAEKFKAACKKHGIPPNSILPHGVSPMNCGSPNPEILKRSREILLDELQKCEALDLTLYNFHPGSTCGKISVERCLNRIAETINWAHQNTKFVITVVENMSCQGNTIGGRFEELKGIIDRVKDKSRIGICLDTCHAFVAGFDLSTKQGFEKFVSDFGRIVGFQYLKAMHLTDSNGPVGCHRELPTNVGKGRIGWKGIRRVMAEPRFDGIPLILKTPQGEYAKEIKMLNNMI